MSSSKGEAALPGKGKKPFFKAFLPKLRKRKIIETLAAFIGGGWLILEVVDRLLVAHYHFPDETIDLTFITILAALICTVLWRWFCGTEKRPGNVKLANIHGEERFKKLLERVKYEWEHFEV